jgi:glycerophosphoryl diester phosphodiesterase
VLPPVPSLIDPPICFAHHGAGGTAPDDTLEGFALALRLGATGLATDVWVTADGEPVLDRDGSVRKGVRRRPIGEVAAAALPPRVPTLAALYEACGTEAEVSLDVRDPAAAARAVAVARQAGGGAEGRLWLCAADWEEAAAWRALSDDIKLVDTTRPKRLKVGPERRVATIADAGIDAARMLWSEWTGGMVTLFHRFGRFALGDGAQHRRQLDALIATGIDGIASAHVERMVDALAGFPERPDPL